MAYGTTTNLFVIGGSNSLILRAVIPDIKASWCSLSFLYDDGMVSCFTNGAFCATAEIVAAEDNGSPLGFGGWPTGREGGSFNGQYDEIRLRGGSLSADRIKADYDMIVNREFISFATASNESGLVPAVSATDTATLDVRHDSVRDSLGDEMLTYSGLWDGDEDATVTIAQDGAALVEGLTGEGERAWSVTRNGTYVLTHTTYTNGVAGKVETATFVVTGKDVPFAEGDVTVADYSGKYDGAAHGIGVTVADGIENVAVKYATALDGEFAATLPTMTDVGLMTVWCEIAAPGYITQTNSATVTITKRAVTLTSGSDSKVYDGTALVKHEVTVSGDGFAASEGATFNVTGSQMDVGTSANTFTYTLNEGTKAGNYDITTVNGTLTVTKATVGPGGGSGGDEPGGGEVPTGGESKFDATVMYDGEGHTIDTNALVAAFGAAVIGEFAVEYAEDDGSGNGVRGAPALPWGTVPAYTNAGEYVVWYRVSNPNYNDFIHAAKVTITNRPVTVTSADGSWTYDGQPHSSASVSTEGFVDGEGVVASNFATITGVGSAANAFDYAFADGTLADNYAVTCVTGTLTIVAATIHYVADNVTGEYNGTGYGIDVSVSAPVSGATVKFAESAEGPWLDSLAYVDVCEDRPIYFQVSATGYTTAVDSRTVTVTPKTLTEDYVWLVLPWEDYVYDGTAKEPEFTCGDGEPSIITLDDFDVSYLDNIDAGTATAVFTGKGNYTGTVTEEFDIWPREVTFTSGSATKVYDGTALVKHDVTVSGDGFIDGEGVTFDVIGSQTNVGASENAFTYTLNEGTKASNYDISTVNGTLTVTKASAGGEGGEEPGGGAVPQEGESKFDVTAMYDGEEHTIDTNALAVAFIDAVIGEIAVEYAADDGSGANGGPGVPALPWLADAPAYTNAGEYVVWYRVTNPNYEDFVHAAKVTITNRPVTVTSGDGSWTYDAQAHSNATVVAEGFVDGEGVVAGDFAAITDVGTVPNAFGYVFADGTLAGNYLVTCVTGTLTVAAAGMDGWTDDAKWSVTLSGDGEKYDGTEKTCEVTALAYDGFAIPTFTVAGNTATDAGGYTLTVTGTGNFSGSHTFPWSIVKRAVTLTSGDASKVYDGIALTNHAVAVSGDGFVAGEGASYNVTGSQTNVGESENTFTYTLNACALAGNYDIATVNGTLTVTRATINPTDVFGGDADETPLVCEKTYNGAQQPVEIAPNFDEACQFLWALTEDNENAYSATAPTLRNVADGERLVYFKFVTENYEPFYGKVVFRILAKELTDEMVVLSDQAFFYDPGSTVKKPSVTVADTNALGVVISTTNDYTVAYEEATAAGAVPVTVTGQSNYFGEVTKTFPVLKRPVPPPTIESTVPNVVSRKSYNGKTQVATIPVDDRWTVVSNPGGVHAGFYTNVVLRLTNPDDYKWKGIDDDEAEWTGVFEIRKANNGWSRYPGMASWTNGETPSEPAGQPKYGTLSVAYRRQGTDVSTETATKPSKPGKYIARFWVDATENYIGVALSTPYEVEFEIYRGQDDTQTHTETTGVPVPYTWLDQYLDKYGAGDYEAAGNANGANGYALWESYLAGLDPENPTSKFRAFIEMQPDGTPKITWSPDLREAEEPRKYTVLGKSTLLDANWTPVTEENKAQMHFFKVKVEMEE